MLKPRGGKPLKAVSGRKLSPTNSVSRSPCMTACETRSGATASETKSCVALRRVVSPSLSSDNLEVVKEVPALAGVLSSKPWTPLSKRWLGLLDEKVTEEEEEGRDLSFVGQGKGLADCHSKATARTEVLLGNHPLPLLGGSHSLNCKK